MKFLILGIIIMQWKTIFQKHDVTPSGGGSYSAIPVTLEKNVNYFISFHTNKDINFYLFDEINYYKWKSGTPSVNEIYIERCYDAIVWYTPFSTGTYFIVFLVPGIFSTEREYELTIIKGESLETYFEIEGIKGRFLGFSQSFSEKDFFLKGTHEDTFIINSEENLHPTIYTKERGGWTKIADFESNKEFKILLKPGEKLKVISEGTKSIGIILLSFFTTFTQKSEEAKELVSYVKDVVIKSNAHVFQVALEEFSTLVNGYYPSSLNISVNEIRKEMWLPLLSEEGNKTILDFLPATFKNPIDSTIPPIIISYKDPPPPENVKPGQIVYVPLEVEGKKCVKYKIYIMGEKGPLGVLTNEELEREKEK